MRLIDADALLDIVKNKYYDITAGRYPFNIVAYDMAKLVEDAPTVGGWIACSERLPKEPEYGCCGYIVQRKRVEEPHSAWWDGEIWTSDDCDVYKDVIAYMPLPEPYKEE